MFHPLTFSLAAFASLLLATSLPARVWTDAETKRTVEAKFLDLKDGQISLQRSDGRRFELPLAQLTAADQDFVREQMAKAPAQAPANWPTWRGPARDNHSPDTGLLKSWPESGPELLWTFEDGGKGYSAPAIVDERLYFTGSRERKALIICLDANNGKELWHAPIGDDPEDGYNTGWGGGPRGAPTISEGLVLALSANGELACVSAKDGSPEWNKDLVKDLGGKVPGWGYSESPLVDGANVIVTPGGKEGAIVAFDKKSGRERWRSKDLTDEAQYSSLVIAKVNGKRQYIQLFMKTLAGVDAENGKLLWTSPWDEGRTAVIPTPVVHGNQVYITSGYGVGCKLIEIDENSAKDLWENKVIKNHHGGVVLVEGHIYGFSDGGGLVCQNLKSGERVWSEKGQGIQKGAVHYADGMLYCIDEHEGSVFLVAASPNSYQEHGRFPMPRETKLREGNNGKVWTHPVVLNGRLYLRDQDLVFCYQVKK